MGYESRLYVVEKGVTKGLNGYRYCEVIAVFNLCKVYEVSNKMGQYPETDGFVYASDGNTEITEDCYGAPLKEIPIKDAIQILKAAAENDDYRRYKPCLGLLKSFDESQWQDIVVLHYGY